MSTIHVETPPQTQTSLKIFASLISWLFHPLLVGLYITIYLVYINPEYFIGLSKWTKLQTIFIYILNSIFFPVISLLLCKALSFIQSFYLHTQKDRIVGYSITMIFFFWTFYVFKNKPDVPSIMAQVSLGVFLATIAAFIANIYIKVSMHAIGAGGLVSLFICILFAGNSVVVVPLAAAILIAGLIATARLLLSAHNSFDIGWGFVIGFLSQLLAAWFIM